MNPQISDRRQAARAIPARQRVRKTMLLILLLIFPLSFNYYSPVLPIMGGFEGVISFSLLFWLLWTLASLFLGRASCGYFCPLGALQELWDDAVGRRLRRAPYVRTLKYVLWLGWLGTIVYAFMAGPGITRVELLYRTGNVVSWDHVRGAIIYGSMFGLVMLLCIPFGRRAFCHYLCWWAPLNTVGSKLKDRLGLPGLRLKAEADKCIQCGACEKGCPMSLPVMGMSKAGDMRNTECILCGSCVDSCRSSAIEYGWRDN